MPEQRQLAVNSFMLLQNGHVTAEFWREPYRSTSPQLLYSLSKSFTSIGVGIAWDEGRLRLEDSVISFFPDKLPEDVSPNLAKMTVRHLLGMNAGHEGNIYAEVAREEDWIKAFLAMDVEHEPGTHYRYSTHSTYMLAAIIERITGESLVGYLMPRLFEPLGIDRPAWETCPKGVTAGGMGLSIRTEDIAKFGQMLLNKGTYEGRRIVSEAYIDMATREQSDNRAAASPGRIDSAQGYGYQFHLCRRGAYRGDGSFGQLCLVAPNANIVIAATSSFSSMQQLQTLLDLIDVCILDRLDAGRRCYDHGERELIHELKRLSRAALPAIRPVPDGAPSVHGRRYRMQENPERLAEIAFFASGDRLELVLIGADPHRERRLSFDFRQPVFGEDLFVKDLSEHRQDVAAYAAWEDARTLKLTLYYIETPYVITYAIAFEGETIRLHFHINVSLTLSDYQTSGTLC
nr:serine hydrolase [Paenibacillus soyae]